MNDKIFAKRIKITAVLGMLVILVPALYMVISTYGRYSQRDIMVENGKVNILDFDNIASKPVVLNGEWHAYEDIYIETETELSVFRDQKGMKPEIRILPETDMREVSNARTYKLWIAGELSSEELNYLAVGIPLANESVKVFLNGTLIERYQPITSWMDGDLNTQMYLLDKVYDNNLEYQELIISVPESDRSGLYRRQISISRVNTYLQQMSSIDALQNFMCGLMVLSVLLGFLYIAIHPTYSVLTFMNLFDICKMLYILLLISDLPMKVYNSFVPGAYGEALMRGMGLMFYFIAALFINILSQVTFDPEKKVARFFLNTINVLWVTGAVFYLLKPQLFTDKAIAVTILIFASTQVGNFLRVRLCFIEGRFGRYEKFLAIKTVCLGGIAFLDLVTMNHYPRNNGLLISLYSIFFMIHFFVRAFVYRKPYDLIEQCNEELEYTVAMRTKELVEANQELKNIAIKDPLTNVYNRLYFEEMVDKALEEKSQQLHLCIFDLDNFKSINDTYGHQVGDEQLIELVETASNCVPEDVIISRIGGEEFTLFFRDYKDETVSAVLEILRNNLEKASSRDGRTTGSFGVAKARKRDTRKALFVRADDCLYEAKENGKNQVVVNFN